LLVGTTEVPDRIGFDPAAGSGGQYLFGIPNVFHCCVAIQLILNREIMKQIFCEIRPDHFQGYVRLLIHVQKEGGEFSSRGFPFGDRAFGSKPPFLFFF